MLELLKIIHFLSFSVAIGAGVANQITGLKLAGVAPEAMPKVGALRLSLGKVTTHGLILLWLTGTALIALTHGAAVFQNLAFLAKFAVVLILTIISVMANLTIAQARNTGTPPDAVRMKKLGIAGLSMAILALILAVIAFS